MKGKSIFTKEDAEQIILLIEQKLKADSVKQKGIRQKIRNLGFFAQESGVGNGLYRCGFQTSCYNNWFRKHKSRPFT